MSPSSSLQSHLLSLLDPPYSCASVLIPVGFVFSHIDMSYCKKEERSQVVGNQTFNVAIILISFCSELQRRRPETFMEADVCLADSCLQIFPSRYADIQISRYPDMQISRYPDMQHRRISLFLPLLLICRFLISIHNN